MQQKKILLDWRFLEDLAAAQGHHPNHHGNSNHCAPRHCQQQLPYDLHCSLVHSHCRFHAAYSPFIRSYLHQRSVRPTNKLAAQISRTSRNIVVPDLLDLQRPTKLRTRNRGCRVISVRLRPPRLPWPSLPSMQRTPPPADRSAQDIWAIVSNIVPSHATISSVQLLPHHRLQQIYEVKVSDMTAMLVVLPPLPILRLLRSEQNMAKSEAAVVRWLRDELLESPPSKEAAVSEPRFPGKYSTNVLATRESVLPGRLIRKVRSGSASLSVMLRANLLQYLPSPVSLESQSQSPDLADMPSFAPSSLSSSSSLSAFSSSPPPVAFNVFRPPPGTPIAALSSPLTAVERMSIDYQAGKLLRRLSRVTSKSGNFGPALTVLAPQSVLGVPQISDLAIGMSSWSVAFHSILESILRDGEDVAVALAYPTIRKHFRRLGHLLDSITTPSLVVVDAMDDTNLLVQRSPVLPHSGDTAVGSGTETTTPKPIKQRSASPTSPVAQEGPPVGNSHSSPSPHFREVRSSSLPPFVESSADIVVTGLRDWSHCIFGDPLFASVFCEHPSTPFLGGFNSADNEGELASPDSFSSQEERENRTVRILLYQCYHAVVQIVRGFYRPGRDQTTQELAARKRLTEILAKLEAVGDDPKRKFRHRKPSGETSTAKKPRSESGDETPRR